MATISENKRARFDYEILETYEAGIELLGFEVKAIKSGRINLAGAYATLKNNELWLLNADIPPYQPNNTPSEYDSKRTRKLLLKRSEINKIAGSVGKGALPRSSARGRMLSGLTLVPLKVYSKNRPSTGSGQGRIKIEIGLGKSKKTKDKRDVLKKRAAIREMRREI